MSEERVKSLLGSAPPCAIVWTILILVTMMASNLLALYSLSITRDLQASLQIQSPHSSQQESILKELAAIKQELKATQQNLQNPGATQTHQQPDSITPHTGPMSRELMEFTSERKLPLGRNPNYGLETMVSPIGHQCYLHKELLDQYMSYKVGELCPDDTWLAQTLMLRACEPLPRRRCFSRTPTRVSSPNPVPDSLWSPGQDSSVIWTHYSCKSYRCLETRHLTNNGSVFYDCADCFDLSQSGREHRRWVKPGEFLTLDELLHDFGKNRIRIGLDLGGGSGSFAARMLERGVTIVTTTLNLNGPFNEFVAGRGLIPIFTTIAQRFPFMDNTLDLVHSMHVLSDWIPVESLEFLLFDVDRVLRPGGFFWLDHFFCRRNQLESVYVPMLEKLRFTRIRWQVSKKLDRNDQEVYLSALLEKPARG